VRECVAAVLNLAVKSPDEAAQIPCADQLRCVADYSRNGSPLPHETESASRLPQKGLVRLPKLVGSLGGRFGTDNNLLSHSLAVAFLVGTISLGNVDPTKAQTIGLSGQRWLVSNGVSGSQNLEAKTSNAVGGALEPIAVFCPSQEIQKFSTLLNVNKILRGDCSTPMQPKSPPMLRRPIRGRQDKPKRTSLRMIRVLACW
jgi:hypothetical protein